MSPRQKELPSHESGTTTTPLPESFRKVLKATSELFNTLLTEDVLRIWKDLLNYCSDAEAVRALKEWQYQGTYFPKPQEILQLVANERDRQKIEKEGCSTECQRRHGAGYNENDIRWMFKRRMSEQGEAWDSERWAELLDELDQKRVAGPPHWRKQSSLQMSDE